MIKQVKGSVQLIYNTLSYLQGINPTLLNGQPAYYNDGTGITKQVIGDGVTPFTGLKSLFGAVASFQGRTAQAAVLTASDITSSLGYVPYNASNPAGYISAAALSPYALLAGAAFTGTVTVPTLIATDNSGNAASTAFVGTAIAAIPTAYLKSFQGRTTSAAILTSSDVTGALGYVPYNSTNPSSYLVASALTPYSLLSGAAFTGAISASGSITALSNLGTTSLSLSGTTISLSNSGNAVVDLYIQSSSNTRIIGPLNSNYGLVLQGNAGAGSVGSGGLYWNQAQSSAQGGYCSVVSTGYGGSYSFDYTNGKHIFSSTVASNSTSTKLSPAALNSVIFDFLGNGIFPGSLSASGATLTGIVTVPTAAAGDNTIKAASTQFVNTAIAAIPAASTAYLTSFQGRTTGAAVLTSSDVTSSLGYTPYNASNPSGYISGSALYPYATLATPTFTGTVTIPTAAAGDNTTRAASTAYVTAAIAAIPAASTAYLVSFQGRTTGAAVLTSSDVTGSLGYVPYNATNPSGYISISALSPYATLASPTLTGTVTVPTPATGDNTTKAASTAYVTASIAAIPAASTAYLGSFQGRTTSAAVLTSSDVTGALTYTPYNSSNPAGYIAASALSPYATLAAPTFTGTVTIPTATAGDSSTKAASTAFVGAAIAAIPAASTAYLVSFQGRTASAAVLTASDITGSLGYTPYNSSNPSGYIAASALTPYATLASPTFTGSVIVPTLAAGDNSNKAASTAYVYTAIAGVAGGMLCKGTWNASTNSPAIVSGTGTLGWFYKVSVAGTTTIDGVSQWNVGDMLLFDGTIWDKIDGIASEVLSFQGRVGPVTLSPADITSTLGFTPYNSSNPSGYISNSALSPYATIASPTFTGVVSHPNVAAGDNSTKSANTAFVTAAIAAIPVASTAYLVSFQGRTTGAAVLTSSDVTGALTYTPYNATNPSGYIAASALTPYATLAGPTFTGTVTIPTATTGDNTTKAASTAFVAASIAAIPAASTAYLVSFQGRTTGAAVLTSSDVTGALTYTPYNATNPSGYIAASALTPYATLAAPTFTGTVTIPTAASGDNTTKAASTAYVVTAIAAIPAASTAYLVSFQGRTTAAAVLTSSDITGALTYTPYNSTNPSGYIAASALTPYATLAAPTFTGTVTIPTAASGDNTTKAASTAYVTAAIAAMPASTSGITSFQGRTTAAAVLTSSDITGALTYTPYNSTNPSAYITATALSPYAPLASPAFTGNVTNAGGVVIGGTNTGLATLMVNATVGATSTNSSGNYSGYTLGQFGTTNPLTINQFTNPTYYGYTTGPVYELASNNTISGSTRTATSAGYASSISFNSINGTIEFFYTPNSVAAGAALTQSINTSVGATMPRIAYLAANGDFHTGGALFSNQLSSNSATIAWTTISNSAPHVVTKTFSTGITSYGIQPYTSGITPGSQTTYSYGANMLADPASAATASIGPTMEFSMFASVYTGNVAAKTIVRGSTNKGSIFGNSTNAISGVTPSVFPKLSIGTFGTTTSSATSNVVVSEFAWFAANTGNLMLFAPTTMGSDSTQADGGQRLQVYGTSYFSGATAYGGAIITGVASAEYGTGEVNRQITASATGAGNNYSTWYRSTTKMGSYGYTDTNTDVLYLTNALGNISINTVTISTAGNLVVPGTASFVGAVTIGTAPAAGDNSTLAATTAWVTTAIAGITASGKKLNYKYVASTGAGTTVNYYATATDDVISCDTSSGGGINIYLLSPTTAVTGKIVTVKRFFPGSSSNAVIVQVAGGASLESTAGGAVTSYGLIQGGNGGSSITWMNNASNYELLYMR